jgi:aldose sugar dehydrogenase
MRHTARCVLAFAAAMPFAFTAPVQAQQEEKESRPLPQQSTVQSQAGEINIQVHARDLVHPWAIVMLPDGDMLVTERNPGHVRLVDRDGRVSQPLGGVPPIFRYEGPTDRSQAGLFDVKLHPQFAQNRLVYLSLSAPTERGAAMTIVRGQLSQDRSRLENVETIFEMQEDDQDSSGLHFGGRMAIDARNDRLYLSIGDRRNISRAQDKEDQAGSFLRLTLDGKVPQDNPFVDDKDVNDYIFAVGTRNSQALTMHPETGELWSVEHGPKGGDRVDRVRARMNLGWPFVTGGVDYSGAPLGVDGIEHEGMTAPRHVFEDTVAPSGAAFYYGKAWPAWQGNLLVGGLYNRSLMRLSLDGDKVTDVERIEIGRRIRDVQVAPDGAVWLITEHEDGELLRLTPAGAAAR